MTMKGSNIRLKSEPNGSVCIETDGASITIDSNGDIHVSSEGPLYLTGASLAKLDAGNLNASQVNDALSKRVTKKR